MWWRHEPGRRPGANRRASTASSLQAQFLPAEEAARLRGRCLVSVLPSYLLQVLTHCTGPTVRHRPGASRLLGDPPRIVEVAASMCMRNCGKSLKYGPLKVASRCCSLPSHFITAIYSVGPPARSFHALSTASAHVPFMCSIDAQLRRSTVQYILSCGRTCICTCMYVLDVLCGLSIGSSDRFLKSTVFHKTPHSFFLLPPAGIPFRSFCLYCLLSDRPLFLFASLCSALRRQHR